MMPDSTDGIDEGKPRADGWGWISSLAGRALRQPLPPISNAFVDGVLARLAANTDSVARRHDERLVLSTAGFALAAALLLALWSWPELSVALRELTPSAETPVLVEPWL